MTNQPAVRPAGLGVIVVVAIAAVVAGLAVWLIDRSGRNGHACQRSSFTRSTSTAGRPALIAYEEVFCIDSLEMPSAAVALRTDSRGRRPVGSHLRQPRRPTADFPPGRRAWQAPPITRRPAGCLPAWRSHRSVFGQAVGHLAVLGAKAILTSTRWPRRTRRRRLRPRPPPLVGGECGAIGGQRGQGWAPFAVPSPFFDVAPPRRLASRRQPALCGWRPIRTRLQLFWGEGVRIDGFFGLTANTPSFPTAGL